MMKKIRIEIARISFVLFSCVSFGIVAQEISLDCRLDHEMFFGMDEYPLGYRQESSLDPISIVLDVDSSTLDYRGRLENIPFEQSGHIVNFDLVFLDGELVFRHEIDLVTKRLELGYWTENVYKKFFPLPKDKSGRSLVQKSIFNCRKVEALF